MMKSEVLELKHKELLAPRFQNLSLDISEYSFANLYLFRKIHAYEVIFDFDIFIKGKTRDGFSYLMPTASMDSLDIMKLWELKERSGVDFLYPIPEGWLSYIGQAISTYDESDSDYIYQTKSFATYPGRHLAGRRNLVKQFVEDHSTVSHPLSGQRAVDAKVVLDQWLSSYLEKKGDPTVDASGDYDACLEALELIEELGLKGRIFYDGEKPIGFILGESLNDEMFVEHFAKASVLYTGVYQFMYQQFALDLDDHFYYVNMEQDLGDPGLKHSKKAYMPDRLVHKYRVKKG